MLCELKETEWRDTDSAVVEPDTEMFRSSAENPVHKHAGSHQCFHSSFFSPKAGKDKVQRIKAAKKTPAVSSAYVYLLYSQ